MRHKHKFIIILLGMEICTQITFSQTNSDTKNAIQKTSIMVVYNELYDIDKTKEQIFDVIEQTPQFPGGEQKLQEYISQNLHYPNAAKNKLIQGKVVIRFVIFETGKVGKCKIIRSLDPDCDKEALRIIQSMPDWTPAKQVIKNVAKNIGVYYTIPILFELQKK